METCRHYKKKTVTDRKYTVMCCCNKKSNINHNELRFSHIKWHNYASRLIAPCKLLSYKNNSPSFIEPDIINISYFR